MHLKHLILFRNRLRKKILGVKKPPRPRLYLYVVEIALTYKCIYLGKAGDDGGVG